MAPTRYPQIADELAEELGIGIGIGIDRPYWKIAGVLEDPVRKIPVRVHTEFRVDRINLEVQIGETSPPAESPPGESR